MKFTSPKGTAFPFLYDYPLWTTLIPCNRQKTYLQVPHCYLGPVYKEGYPCAGVTLSPRSTSPALLMRFAQILDKLHSNCQDYWSRMTEESCPG